MNEITLTFTPGQLFAVIGAICLVAFTIALVCLLVQGAKTLKETRGAAAEAKELIHSANEMLDDIRTTTGVVLTTIGKVKNVLNIAEKFDKKSKKKKDKGED